MFLKKSERPPSSSTGVVKTPPQSSRAPPFFRIIDQVDLIFEKLHNIYEEVSSLRAIESHTLEYRRIPTQPPRCGLHDRYCFSPHIYFTLRLLLQLGHGRSINSYHPLIPSLLEMLSTGEQKLKVSILPRYLFTWLELTFGPFFSYHVSKRNRFSIICCENHSQ